MKSELTPQQTRFANEVAFGKTQSEAYRIAYPKSQNWKEESVWCESSKLMMNTTVLQRVTELQADAIKAKQATLDEILIGMSTRVRLDIRTYFNEDGSFISPKEMTKEQAMCLSKFKVREIWGGSGENRTQIGQLIDVEFIDLKGLWDMFMKRFGQYVDNKSIKFDSESIDHIRDILESIK